jgi:hypothetical protein
VVPTPQERIGIMPIHFNRWGNRPASMLMVEDIGCCASG